MDVAEFTDLAYTATVLEGQALERRFSRLSITTRLSPW